MAEGAVFRSALYASSGLSLLAGTCTNPAACDSLGKEEGDQDIDDKLYRVEVKLGKG